MSSQSAAGFDVLLILTSFTVLKRIYGADAINNHNYSTTLSSVAFAGTIVGMLVFGYISDKVGRKFGMVSALLPIASASFLPLCLDASCLIVRLGPPAFTLWKSRLLALECASLRHEYTMNERARDGRIKGQLSLKIC